MKTYIYLMLTFFVLPWPVFAQQSINGYITRSGGLVYFHSVDSSTPVIMSAGSNNVSEVLNKLEAF